VSRALRLLAIPLALAPLPALAGPFTYNPPGDLISGSGQGRVDDVVYAPGMRFPMEQGPAFANSQVYNAGGSLGPGGGQCDASNYDYPWRDNYCEIRQWDMPLCPAGTGHQGQDIRAATCEKDVHWVVAVDDGTITHIGSYTVYLTNADGTRFDYLHMDSVQVSLGDQVTRGQRLGRVSNNFGGTATTIHLHFNIQQDVEGLGAVFVPPYTSLIAAYEELFAPPEEPPAGSLEGADCAKVTGWSQDPNAPDGPVDVTLTFDGLPGNPDATSVTVTADETRDDLCAALGSCDHGFSASVPSSLLDGEEHVVHAFAADTATGTLAELAGSPKSLLCSPAPTGAGGAGGSGGSGGGIHVKGSVHGEASCSCEAPGSSPPPGTAAVALALAAAAIGRRRRR
jgi:MYXO-CTERM domain-containing protein